MGTAVLANRIDQMLTLVETLEFGDALFETIIPLAFGPVLMCLPAMNLLPDFIGKCDSERHFLLTLQFPFFTFIPDIRQIQSAFKVFSSFSK